MKNSARTEKRYSGIDALKFLCAFLVVCIHQPFPGIVGLYVVAISRIAVPVFFMITGFFYNIDENREKTQIVKLLKIILFASILYFVWNFIIGIAKFSVSGNIDSIFKVFEVFNLKSILKLVFLNESPIAGHLWYLNAIVYVFLCSCILKKAKIFKVLYWITPLLLCVDLIFGKYSIAIFGREFNALYVRNFLFVGIPYFIIGNVIRYVYIQKHLNVCSHKYLLCVLMIFSALLCILEKYIILFFEINAARDHYISTTLLACVMFVLFLTAFPADNKKLKWISDIGRNNSLDIYIIHPIVIFVLNTMSEILKIEKVYSYAAPVLVFGVSILLSAFYRRMMSHFKNKRNCVSEGGLLSNSERL